MTDKPRFNHVAMTVSPDLLDDDGRKAILDFYGEVFGWEELPTMTEDRKRLVLMAYEFGQFVFLEAGEPTLRASVVGDHFGMAVATVDELDAMRERALAWQQRDDRVTVTERKVDDFGVLDLTSFYTHYLLPLTVEVQHFNWKHAA
ncbi:MAG TPA: hypothetical protein VG708_04310 [Mycobacteriales bacterium]|nr:hypothetical protein [Mycobacteriales bacterium]